MKTRILLLPLLLTLTACRHLPPPVPTEAEIQRAAPPGGLVRVTLREQKQPYRFTTYLVDVSRNEIVDKVHGSAREETQAQDSTAMKSASGLTESHVMSDLNVYTECDNPKEKPGCNPSFRNGDPIVKSGGGGDPTGHDPERMVRRLAALSFWSIQQVGIPLMQKPMTQPAPTRGQ
jgi:hypothetical protein